MRKVFLLFIAATLVASAADPMFGTWKFNLEKSKVGNPSAWKGRLMIIESAGGDAYRSVFVTPTADGKTQRTEEIRYLDGKEHPRSTNPGETIVTRTINDHHRILIFKKDGKETSSMDSTISADGKVLTNVYKGPDANGKQGEQLRVWDRQ